MEKKGIPLDAQEFINMLSKNNIYLSDGGNPTEQVKEWLDNEYSGYPDIAAKIIDLLHDQKIGSSVPIDNISGKYGYAITHDLEKLKAAYIAAWREKNGF